MEENFIGTNFHGFRRLPTFPWKFIPAKCSKIVDPPKLIPTKYSETIDPRKFIFTKYFFSVHRAGDIKNARSPGNKVAKVCLINRIIGYAPNDTEDEEEVNNYDINRD